MCKCAGECELENLRSANRVSLGKARAIRGTETEREKEGEGRERALLPVICLLCQGERAVAGRNKFTKGGAKIYGHCYTRCITKKHRRRPSGRLKCVQEANSDLRQQ